MKILLCAPPFRQPNESTLAIATLRPILEAAGHEVDELHGSPMFPATNHHLAPALSSWNARYAFGRPLVGCSVDEYVEIAVQASLTELDAHGIHEGPDRRERWATLGADENQVRADMREKVQFAEVCIERMVAHAVAHGPFDVVGFSTMFTNDQVPAAVILARRLKAIWPTLKIAFGGPACFEEQADGLLATFAEIDAACHTEGEQVIVPMFEALLGLRPLAEVPGITWRDGAGALHRNPSPPLLRVLDELPFPDYRGFVDQLNASEWAAQGAELFFETSRGCWWGEKSLCTFCGLNAEGLTYRAKSPERAFQEISAIHARYPASFLRAADNILDFRYINTLFPRLRELATDPERPLRMFFEIKSNIKPEQLETLVAGGVREVQPGIESFSDGILKLMRKGNNATGQVQFIKWAHQAGLTVSYNILILSPGEATEHYRAMMDLLPFIEHLPPPLGTPQVLIERFSPYQLTPAEFGIRNLRPNDFFRSVFGDGADTRLVYKFDCDHDIYEDDHHLDAVRALVRAVKRWQASWRPGLAYFVDELDELLVVDGRDGPPRSSTISGHAARIYVFLDQARTRELIGRAFPALHAEVVDALLLTWLHRRWICAVGDRYLAVLPRRGPAKTAVVKVAPAPREPGPVRLGLV